MIRINRFNFKQITEQHLNYFEKFFEDKLITVICKAELKNHKNFLEYLFSKKVTLLTGTPRELEFIRNELYNRYKNILVEVENITLTEVLRKSIIKQNLRTSADNEEPKEIENVSPIQKLRAYLEYIFDYDHFVRGTKGWGAYHLVKQLKVEVCPYCNRHYTSTLDCPIGKTRPQLDHFYSQEKYPYFALSLFNLVPSCYVCNSNLKRNNEFSYNTHLHPYDEEGEFSDRVRFSVNFPKQNLQTDEKKERQRDYLSAWLGNSDDFKISLLPVKLRDPLTSVEERRDYAKFLIRARNNCKVFKLRELYQNHKDYVQDIIINAIVYSESEIQNLLDAFPDLFVERKDVLRMITSNYISKEELDKRVLAKLTRDIWQEFGLKIE
ncbi:hypothetical protein [Priestia aryabhattai]|uniref:hypothetical protein n=1 Tax=Priestia aryabhattai TaxID=412384 RepID=UPI003D281250